MFFLLQLMRPKQWIKNGFVLAPLLFSFQFNNSEQVLLALIACVCFIAASSVVYIINDIMDAEEDRKHPKKKHRPIAAEKVTVKTALFMLLPLLGVVAATLLMLPLPCSFIFLGYIALNNAYSKWLKKMAIIDVLVIATGFVLRLLMGSFAIDVVPSSWIILSTFLLALFIGFGKRFNELGVQGYDTVRESLMGYNEAFLNKLLSITSAATLVCYALYTVEVGHETGNTNLVYTTFFVVFGLFRYLQRIHVDNEGGEPEIIITKDRLFLGNAIVWLASVLWILDRG